MIIAAFLIAGPQVWAFGERLTEYLPRPIAGAPKSPSGPDAVDRTARTPVRAAPASDRALRAPVRVTAPAATPATPSRPQTPVQATPQPVTTPRPRVKPKSAPTPRTAYSQVLLEQAQVESDARKYYEALMQQGFQLYRSGWYGPAMGRFRQATAVVPKSAYAHLWVGRAGIKAGRYAEARDALERVIELAPTSDVARLARALLDETRF